MRRWRQLAFLLALLAPVAAAGEMVDRIVARVNHQVILQSEVDDALRYEALVGGREPGPFSAQERKQVTERLVDLLLIDEQINRATFVHASPEQIERQIADLRAHLPGAVEDAAWQALLGRYGLSEADVRQMVGRQLDIFRFVDAQFRPTIHIDKRSIETYYLEQLIPQLHRSGAQEVPLSEVSGKIEEILIQQRMNELMTVWLRNLRLQQEVKVQ